MPSRAEPLPPPAHFGPELSSSLSLHPAAPPLPAPRLLPDSEPDHPVVYLPVPDPASLHYLIHYMYFGSTYHIDQALDRGTLSWDGVARNVEYLGMSTDVELFLALYWRYLRAFYGRVSEALNVNDEVNTAYDIEIGVDDPMVTPVDDGDQHGDNSSETDDEGRGRARGVRPLAQSSATSGDQEERAQNTRGLVRRSVSQ